MMVQTLAQVGTRPVDSADDANTDATVTVADKVRSVGLMLIGMASIWGSMACSISSVCAVFAAWQSRTAIGT